MNSFVCTQIYIFIKVCTYACLRNWSYCEGSFIEPLHTTAGPCWRMECVSEGERISLCVNVCVCVRKVNDSQRRHSGSQAVLSVSCVLRGSEIRGATKSFLTLTHCVACLLNRVIFCVFVVSALCVFMKQRAGRQTEHGEWWRGQLQKSLGCQRDRREEEEEKRKAGRAADEKRDG